MKKSDEITQHPNAWRAAFQSQAMRTSFCLSLSQPMLELLCAVADSVRWDRGMYYRQYGIAKPDSSIASSHALAKRGLIHDHPERGSVPRLRGEAAKAAERGEYFPVWALTPAGEALVQLLKVTGIFIEADAAINKKARRGK